MNDEETEITKDDELDEPIPPEEDNLFGNDFDLGYNDYMDEGSQEPMDKHRELLRDLTDFDSGMRDKVNYWLGWSWSESQEKFVPDPNLIPIMNERGALWCISFLKNYAKKTNIITHILKGDYNYIHEDIIDVLWEEFATKCEEFGIKNNNDLKRVCIEMEHEALLVLMGAGDGKYNKLLKESTHRNESINYTGNPNPNQQPNQPIARKMSQWERLKSKFSGG